MVGLLGPGETVRAEEKAYGPRLTSVTVLVNATPILSGKVEAVVVTLQGMAEVESSKGCGPSSGHGQPRAGDAPGVNQGLRRRHHAWGPELDPAKVHHLVRAIGGLPDHLSSLVTDLLDMAPLRRAPSRSAPLDWTRTRWNEQERLN